MSFQNHFYRLDADNLHGLIVGLEDILADLKSSLRLRQFRERGREDIAKGIRQREAAGERALLYHNRGLSVEDAVQLVARETGIATWCVAGNMRAAKKRLKSLDRHTRRERAVLERLAGRKVKNIAHDLGVSPSTIYRDTSIRDTEHH